MARFTIKTILRVAGKAVFTGLFPLLLAHGALADGLIPQHILGKADAPVTVDEYVSLTCSHCAAFYNEVLPQLEKQYIDSGKVKFILHDFPLDGLGLRAAALARCMPDDQYYAFIKILYSSQKDWVLNDNAEKILIQYARLGGLAEDKAKACIADDKMMDAIVNGRTDASQKYDVEATPTFIISGPPGTPGGAHTVKGTSDAASFAKVFDQMLAAKK